MDGIISQFVKALIEFISKLKKQIVCGDIENELTIKSLKAWRLEPKNKIILTDKKVLIREINASQRSLDNIGLGDAEVILAEYDPDKDEILQLAYCKHAGELERVLNDCDGIVILD